MRETILLGLVLLATMSALGQGEITFRNFGSTAVRTNSIGIGGTAGNTSSNASGFFYGLFIAASTVTSLSPTDLLTPTWTFTGVYATNTVVTDGRLYGGTGVQVPGWVDVTNSFVVVGWSANIASSDWVTVAPQLSGASLSGGVWSGPNWHASSQGGFFGVSTIGLGFAPDPSLGQPPLELFASGPTPQGYPISTGWDLFTINVPEPSFGNLLLVGILIILVFRAVVRARQHWKREMVTARNHRNESQMKAALQTLLVFWLAALAHTEISLAQGSFQGVFDFSNGGINNGARAPIYGPDPNNPSSQKWGNPTNATPPGTQVYFGSPLDGTNYSVQAWYSTNPVSNPFQLLPDGRPVPESLGTQFFAGFFPTPPGNPTVPDALPNPNFDPNNAAWWTNSVLYAFFRSGHGTMRVAGFRPGTMPGTLRWLAAAGQWVGRRYSGSR